MNLLNIIGPIEKLNPDPTESHHSIIWGNNDMLARTVELFLEKRQWQVVRISSDNGVDYLIQEMKRIRPDVVILCQDKVDDSAIPWRLLDEKDCLKVLAIGMDSNLMHVYCKQDILLQEVNDLAAILERGSFSDHTAEKEVGT